MKRAIAIKRKKVGIYVAHDDDAILGTGGTIVRLVKSNNDVYIVIFTDGRNSHKAVLGIENNPSVQEVRSRRKEEIIKAMAILGVPEKKLHFIQQSFPKNNYIYL